MLVGVMADTHDEFELIRRAVETLSQRHVGALVHCGDLLSDSVVEICSRLPFYFVFGNHDADNVPVLEAAAARFHSTCLGWGGDFFLSGKQIAVAHGHMTMDIRPLIEKRPDYLLTGHSHQRSETWDGSIHRICPGALHRVADPSIAIINTETDHVEFVEISL